jgi:hypothetical protein
MSTKQATNRVSTEAARKYVREQIEIMKKHGLQVNISDKDYPKIVRKVVERTSK